MERSDERSEAAVLNMGILGASWIAPTAVITPLKFVKDVRAYALASRDLQKAQKYQSMYKIEKIYNDYAELIADEKVDIIYNSLPNSHHKEWTIRALRAGKHVLCEKPLACNEEEVIEMFQVAREQDRLLLEAYHWRFHPLAAQIEQTLRSGELGKIHKAHAEMRIAILRGSDIRYNYDLGGGSTMDTGCYALSALVFLMETLSSASSSPEEDKQKQKMKDENGEEREEGAEFPFEAVVEKAVATCCYPQIDKHMNAELKLKLRKEKEGEDEGQEDTIAATMRCSIYNLVPSLKFVIEGEAATLSVNNFVAPHIFHRMSIQRKPGASSSTASSSTPSSSSTTKLWQGESTYTHQLRSFAKAVKAGITANSTAQQCRDASLPFHPYSTSLSIARLVDQVYTKAGLEVRGKKK
ncbi:Gfo/Idh/MocA family oxidoreductase [Balamuthia mandrillaris]